MFTPESSHVRRKITAIIVALSDCMAKYWSTTKNNKVLYFFSALLVLGNAGY